MFTLHQVGKGLEIVLSVSLEEASKRKWTMVGLTSLAAGIYAGYKLLKGPLSYLVDDYGRVPLTWLVDRCSVNHRDVSREAFRNIWFPTPQGVGVAHSHADAARFRHVTNEAMDRFVANAGYKAYSVSPSDRDDRRGCDGWRLYYAVKSLAQSARYSAFGAGHMIKLVDVDYYVNMPAMLRHRLPIVLSTFCPTTVGDSLPDAVFSIDKNDFVNFRVQGGAEYHHQLWDYESDFFVAHYWWGTVVYSAESVLNPHDNQRRIVLLVPRRTIYGPIGWLFTDGRKLERRRFNVGKYVTVRSMVQDGDRAAKRTFEQISVSRPGLTFSATLPAAFAYTLCQRVVASKNAPLATLQAAITTMVEKERYPTWGKKICPVEMVSLLIDAMKESPDLFGVSVFPIVSIPGFSPHYTVFDKTCVLDETTETMRVTGPYVPLASGGFTPTACLANDKACIKLRVHDARNELDTKDLKVPTHYYTYMREFVDLLVGSKRHTGVPADLDEVYERQSRLSQRNILERFSNWTELGGKNVISSFQKREAYGKITAPRLISTLKGDVKMMYSTFMYPLAENVLYDQPWYAFSKTPIVIAESVERLCRSAEHVIPTDFKKFDGHHCSFFCELEEMVGLAFFAKQYHGQYLELYRSQYKTIGYTGFGIKYDTGYSRLSGSPETSAFNTICNAFVAYVVLRQQFTGSEGRARAWSALGIYGGDDGVTPDVPVNTYRTAAAKMGMPMTIEKVVRGESVPFLSRRFTECWDGGLGSYTEVARQVAKLHLTTSPADVPEFVVNYRKAIGYLLTDGDTPVLGAWSRAVVRIAMVKRFAIERAMDTWKQEIAHDQRWFETYDAEVQFPQPEDKSRVQYEVSQALCSTVEEIERLEMSFETATEFQHLFAYQAFDLPRKVEVSAICGNEVFEEVGAVEGPSASAAANPAPSAKNPIRTDVEKTGKRRKPRAAQSKAMKNAQIHPPLAVPSEPSEITGSVASALQ